VKTLVADQQTILRRIAELLEKELTPVIGRRGFGVLALPGGRSVLPIIGAFPKISIPWDRVRLFLVDERWVQRDHPESNYRLIVDSLAQAFGDAAAKPEIVAPPAPAGDGSPEADRINDSEAEPTDAAAAYDALLKEHTAGVGTFDFAILGVGEDGHIASLFPGRPLALDAAPGFAVVRDSPKPPSVRLTANASLITSTPCVVGLLFGEAKQQAYRRLTSGESAATLPAALVREAARGYLFADYSAAGASASQ
jgi:6-phosphogluconolactonase